MNRPVIIGVVGKKRSGKDTFCEAARQTIPVAAGNAVVKRLSFGDLLKAEVSEATGVSLATIEKQKARFRLALQWWGTEFRRQSNINYWVKRLRRMISVEDGNQLTLLPPIRIIYVVTDCRFMNEANLVKSMGGTLIRVHRPDIQSDDAHRSETEQDYISCDGLLRNTEIESYIHMARELVHTLFYGGDAMTILSRDTLAKPYGNAKLEEFGYRRQDCPCFWKAHAAVQELFSSDLHPSARR